MLYTQGEPDLAGLHALRRAFVRHLSAGNIPVKAKAKVEEEVQVKTSGKSSLKRPLPPDNSASAEAARAGLARYQTLLLKGLSHQDAVVKVIVC